MKKEFNKEDMILDNEASAIVDESAALLSDNYEAESFDSIRNLFVKAIEENPLPQKRTRGDFIKYVKYEAQKLKFLTPSKRSLDEVEKIDGCLKLEAAEEYVENYIKGVSNLNVSYIVVDNKRELTEFGKAFLSNAPIIKMSYFSPSNENQKWICDAMRADGSREQAIILQMCEESYFGKSNKANEVIDNINKMLYDGGWRPLDNSNMIDRVVISCIKNDAKSAAKLKLDGPIGGIRTLAALIG